MTVYQPILGVIAPMHTFFNDGKEDAHKFAFVSSAMPLVEGKI